MMLRRNVGAASLSKRTGIPIRTINHWFNGDRTPPLGSPYRAKVAKALGVPLDWLNGLDDEEARNADPGNPRE
jgi:transcriptional regulator with XRE-family HTH domain